MGTRGWGRTSAGKLRHVLCRVKRAGARYCVAYSLLVVREPLKRHSDLIQAFDDMLRFGRAPRFAGRAINPLAADVL